MDKRIWLVQNGIQLETLIYDEKGEFDYLYGIVTTDKNSLSNSVSNSLYSGLDTPERIYLTKTDYHIRYFG